MTDRLAGKRILVVEDEYFIAADLKRALADEGAVILGPVGQLDQGLAIAAAETIDAAILDMNLEGGNSCAIADRLTERGVPLMFVTGYDAWSMPAGQRDAPRVAKPFNIETVLTMVAGLASQGAAP